ncbi:hypothetical protein T492DRAFT_858617 [Pavlovales sp. CCMP2436]|nr:hypothetical protein T492DRAFT_858617 [Pavlovales sp. CCMP2436]
MGTVLADGVSPAHLHCTAFDASEPEGLHPTHQKGLHPPHPSGVGAAPTAVAARCAAGAALQRLLAGQRQEQSLGQGQSGHSARTFTWCAGPHSSAQVEALLAACPPHALVLALVPLPTVRSSAAGRSSAGGGGTEAQGGALCAMTMAIVAHADGDA